MLEKFIVNIKNIIFFKSVIYFLIIFFLLWLLPTFKDDYRNSLDRMQSSEKAFSEAAVKLYSIIDSESKILDTYRTYEEILNTSPEHLCILRATIMYKVRALAATYNIEQPAVTFSQVFKDSSQRTSGGVKINNYDVAAKFTSPDVKAFQNMIKQVYLSMPEYSIVVFTQLENDEFLDPKLIERLTPDTKPNMLHAELDIRIRELSIK